MTQCQTYTIYLNVYLGENAHIQDGVILGLPPFGKSDGEYETRIGRSAIIRSHSVIYAGNVIGDGFCTGHAAMIREHNEIGQNVSIGTHSIVEHHIRIGSDVRIHSNVFIPEYSVLEDHAWVGPGVVFTNADYPLSPAAKVNLKGPHLMGGAKVGAHATLLPGVVVGRHALVGAGAVVVRDVPDYAVVVGNPARVINDIRNLAAYHADQRA